MERYLTVKDLAKILGYSPATIQHYVSDGKLPKPQKIFGRKNVWTQKAIEDWLEEKGININNKE